MPIDIEKAPNTLPEEAKRVWVSVFNKSYDGTCSEKSEKDRDECAARIAWGAVKNSWKKDESGEWTKKSEAEESLKEFSFYITKVSRDTESGELKWCATASDTGEDLYEEYMSKELFQDFIDRIERNESPPAVFCSKAWKGGMPYVSIAHYLDLEGKGIAGETTSLYIDGEMFKAKGIFRDTDLGRAAFSSIYKSKKQKEEKPVRISIAFYDLAHRHIEEDFVFERSSPSDKCPLCAEKPFGNKEYLSGILVHLALTRVPANVRTDITARSEVIMTVKQDATSIVGEELAEELEQTAQKSVVSRTEPSPEGLVVKDKEETEDEVVEPVVEDVPEVEPEKDPAPEPEWIGEIKSFLSRSELVTKDHVLREPIVKLLQSFDNLSSDDGKSSEEKLRNIQPVFAELGETISVSMKSKVVSEAQVDEVVRSQVNDQVAQAVQPLQDQIALLTEQISAMTNRRSSVTLIPEPRNLNQEIQSFEFKNAVEQNLSETPNLRSIVRKSVNLG